MGTLLGAINSSFCSLSYLISCLLRIAACNRSTVSTKTAQIVLSKRKRAPQAYTRITLTISFLFGIFDEFSADCVVIVAFCRCFCKSTHLRTHTHTHSVCLNKFKKKHSSPESRMRTCSKHLS